MAEIVAAKGDEQVRFVDDPRWVGAEVKQELLGGDVLRTGAHGSLAVLFRDATQIRIHRNSELHVKAVRGRAGATETLLRLERGATWSRARSVPDGPKIETPAAVASIRGTDWSLRVEDTGRTTLVVLTGQVELASPFGSVLVGRGEMGVAEVGQPPTKTTLVRPKDRPQWELAITPEWVLTLNVTGLPPTALKEAEQRLRERSDADALVGLAEIAYELDDAGEARRRLADAVRMGAPAQLTPRIELLEGLLLAREYRYDAAGAALAAVLPRLAGRPAVIAELGVLAVALGQQRHADADALLARLRARHPDDPDVHLATIRVLALRAERERALEEAVEGRRRFPRDSRFPVWVAQLALIADEPDRLREAVDAALALDPRQHLAWQLKGLQHEQGEGAPRAAMAAFRETLELAPGYAPAWNSLGRVWADLGAYDRAREALLRAIQLAPNDALYRASLATLDVVYGDELLSGRAAAEAALERDPADATAFRALGYLALKEGRNDDALTWMLRATVANPGLGLATTELAIAYYQAGEYDEAARTIDTALRLDPNDPIAGLVGSVMALDRFEAGRAITLAREALDRQLRVEASTVETLAATQSGLLNLGSAYTGLGLADWGRYYGLVSFDPGQAFGHLFLGNQYESATARRSEIAQGLLLDPLAVAARARYFDFVRRPFHDLTIGTSLGTSGGALTDAEFGTLQGFVRGRLSLAYFAGYSRQNDAGFRDNSATRSERLDLALGARPDWRHGVLAALTGSRLRFGVPDREDRPDPDDHVRSERVEGTLGYHHRFGAANHLLARVVGGWQRDRFDNPEPFGARLSPLSASLIRAFGVDAARTLYAGGLRSGGPLGPGLFAGSPVFFPVSSGICPACPVVPSDIPASLELDALRSVEAERSYGAVQLRHLFEIGAAHVTYGAEWAPARVARVARVIGAQPLGTGTGVIAPNLVTFLPFALGEPSMDRSRTVDTTQAAIGYASADWRPIRNLLLDAGLFVRYLDDDDRTRTTQPDPRAGIAWRVRPHHWLRAAAQRDRVVLLPGSLAPTAAVGLPPRDDFSVEGGSATTYQARWDGEWHRRLFTFVALDEQRRHRVLEPIPYTIDAFTVEHARLRSAIAGANLWLGEGWGLFATHRWTDAENTSRDPNRGRDLPLIPASVATAGLTWMHPAHVAASAVLSRVGERPADPANTHDLAAYWTAGLRANWQPDRKRWSFTLAIDNLFDRRYELADGIRAPGFTMSVAAEYRWDLR